jgi:hypothetical protein
MTWIAVGVVWFIIASALGVAFGRMAAPQTEEERRADDEAQIAWLHQCRGRQCRKPPVAHAAQANESPGGEATKLLGSYPADDWPIWKQADRAEALAETGKEGRATANAEMVVVREAANPARW